MRGQRCLGLLEVVGGEEDGHALSIQVTQEAVHLPAQRDIDAGGGLVEEQKAWPVDEGSGHHEAPLHPARQLPHADVPLVGEGEPLQQIIDVMLVRAQAEQAPLEAQQLPDGEDEVEADLLRDDPDAGAQVGVAPVQGLAVEPDDPQVGVGPSGEDVDEGRLPGSVRPEQSEEVPFVEAQ